VQAALQRIEAPAIIQLNFQAHRGLCGGDKGSQDADIKNAHAMWKELNLPAKKAGQQGVIMAAKSKRRKVKVAPTIRRIT